MLSLPAALLACACLLVAAGCAHTGRRGGVEPVATESGRVQMDYACRRHLEVEKHTVKTYEDGRMQVEVQWKNGSGEDFSARVNVVFYGPDGEPIADMGQWVTCSFPPNGIQGFQVSAPRRDAESYIVLVESTGWWPF
jgi:hypothetical protein